METLSAAALVGRKSVNPVVTRADLILGENETSYVLTLSRRQSDLRLQAAATSRP